MIKQAQVYFAACVNWDGTPMNAIKIGTSFDPKVRAEGLSAGQPYTCNVLAHCAGGRVEEGIVHEFLREHRLDGEFFKNTPEVQDVISSVRETSVLPFPLVGVSRFHRMEVSRIGARAFLTKHGLSVPQVIELTGRHDLFFISGLKQAKTPRTVLAALVIAALKAGKNVNYDLDFGLTDTA